MTDSVAQFQERIAPELAEYVRPITDAQLHPENVRKHKIEKIAQSLEKHGQRALIIVQASTGYIVKGNGTQTAAQMLGWEHTAQMWQNLTDEEALAFLYADNRASDLASYDRKKLRDGLAKMMAGPGLFDSLWEVEEFEDLDEEIRGATLLDPQPTDTAYATPDGDTIKPTEKPRLPGERMREVPLVLTIADHALFVERMRILQKRFGTGGTIATIVEAVRRQSEAEAGDVATGKALSQEAVYSAQRAIVKEIRDYITTMGIDRNYSGSWLVAQLERMVPYRNVSQPVVTGQVAAFGDAETTEPVEADMRVPEVATEHELQVEEIARDLDMPTEVVAAQLAELDAEAEAAS